MRFLRAFFSRWGWLALGAAILAAIAWSLALSEGRQGQHLAAEGVETTAWLTSVYRSKGDKDDGFPTYRYHARYQFTVNGIPYVAEQDLSYDFYRTIGTGQQVPVRYWPPNPAISEIEPGRTSANAWTLGLGALGLSFVALVFAQLSWMRARDTVWLYRHGVRQHAMVTGHILPVFGSRRRSRGRATWREEDGREGMTLPLHPDRLPAVGSYISVLVDPEGNRDSIWIGDL